jgi:hypothetical protein
MIICAQCTFSSMYNCSLMLLNRLVQHHVAQQLIFSNMNAILKNIEAAKAENYTRSSSHMTAVRSNEHVAMTWPNSGCAQATRQTDPV